MKCWSGWSYFGQIELLAQVFECCHPPYWRLDRAVRVCSYDNCLIFFLVLLDKVNKVTNTLQIVWVLSTGWEIHRNSYEFLILGIYPYTCKSVISGFQSTDKGGQTGVPEYGWPMPGMVRITEQVFWRCEHVGCRDNCRIIRKSTVYGSFLVVWDPQFLEKNYLWGHYIKKSWQIEAISCKTLQVKSYETKF